MLALINGYPDLARYWTLSWKNSQCQSWVHKIVVIERFLAFGVFFSQGSEFVCVSVWQFHHCLCLFVNIVLKSWKGPFLSLFGVWSTMRAAWVGASAAYAFLLKATCLHNPRFFKKWIEILLYSRETQDFKWWEKFHLLILVEFLAT